MAVDAGSAVGYLDLDISGFLKGLKSAQEEADKTSKNIVTKIGGNISSAGKTLTSAGTTLTKNVTVPLLGIGAAGIKVASDFEKGMSQVKAISGATGKEFDALKEKAIELGADTAFSANEVAEAMTEMAKAGWSSQQIIDGMGGVLNAAAASGEDLATVSTIVADAITGFGLEAKESSKIADLLTQAANSGTIGVTDLGESFKYIAPVASSMGLSIEDVTTAISAMSMSGIKGSQAGTSLRTMLARMVKPTDQVSAAMEELGIVITNQDGTFKSLDTIVTEMRGSFDGLTDDQKAYYATTLAGQEGMSGMLALLNLSQEEYDAISESMNNANGVAEETASIMQDNLQSNVEQLGGALESLAIKLSEHVIPYIRQFVQWLTTLIDKFTNLNPETQKMILKFAGIAIVIGPAITIIGKLTTGVGSLVTAFGKLGGGFKAVAAGGKAGAGVLAKLGGALASITAPIAAVIGIVGVLAAAFVSLWKTNEEFRNTITKIWGEIKATFERFTSGIVERINRLGFDFESFGEVLKAIWQGICDFLAPVFEGVFQTISVIFDTFVSVFFGIWDFFHALFTGDWQACWDSIKGIFESIWGGISGFFEGIVNTIIGIGQTILGWFGIEWNASVESVGNTFKEIWQGVADFFTGLWNGVRDFFTELIQGIWDKVKPLFEEIAGAFQMAWDVIKLIWDFVQPYFAAIWEGIKAVFSVVVEVLGGFFKAAWEAIKVVWDLVAPFFSAIWEGIKTVFSVVGSVLGGFFKTAWEAIKAVWDVVIKFFTAIWAGIKAVFAVVKGVLSGNFKDAWEAIKNLWNKVVDFFKSIWNGIKNIFGSVASWFGDVFSKAWEGIKKIFSKVGDFFTGIWDTIKGIFSKVGSIIGDAISGAVKGAINWILDKAVGLINGFISGINWAIGIINKIPGVELNKINLLEVPQFAKGGVVNGPTVAMIGEDGREAVVPLEKNLGWMKNLVNEFIKHLSELFNKHFKPEQIALNEKISDIRNFCKTIVELGRRFASDDLGYVSYQGFKATKRFKNPNKNDNPDNRDSGGDTFNFYSPKPIDEIEAAKQLKKTKRELAEGF